MSGKKTGLSGFTRLITTYGLYISFFIIFVVFYMNSDVFLTGRNMVNILYEVSFIAIIAAGMTFVIITGGIDLSVGSVTALVGVFMAFLLTKAGLPAWPSLILGLCGVAPLGAATGGVIVKFNIPPFIATLAMMGMARGVARFFFDDRSISHNDPALGFIGQYRMFDTIPFAVIVMLVVFFLAYLLSRRTRFGRYVFAIGGNEEAVHLSGINVKKIKLMVYVLCAVLSGISGILMATRANPFGGIVGDPKIGDMYELHAIAAVVVGGTSLSGGRGSIIGTLIGALFIGVLNNGLQLLNVKDYWQLVVRGAVILAAVLLDQMKNK
jgi:ribose/xylose/arabinose/galactoside ABC-type transport system permease subunit